MIAGRPASKIAHILPRIEQQIQVGRKTGTMGEELLDGDGLHVRVKPVCQVREHDLHARVPLERTPFVLATGASETELLGDVRHDPYGGHPQLGTDPFDRIVPGAMHEAHEGVLFIDELPNLGHLQRFILTAMQEKRFPISGRNPQSAGASYMSVGL